MGRPRPDQAALRRGEEHGSGVVAAMAAVGVTAVAAAGIGLFVWTKKKESKT